MRKLSSYPASLLKLLAPSLLLIFFTISGCKKVDIDSENNNIANNNFADKVLTYLESQKITTRSAVSKNANIDLLKENLDLNAARIEQIDSTVDFLIDKNSQGLAPGPTLCKESEIFELWERIFQSRIM